MSSTTTPEPEQQTSAASVTIDRLLLDASIPKASARAVFKDAEVDPSTAATDEQVTRAGKAPAGLKGKALGIYIVTGERMKAQTSKAAASRKATTKAKTTEHRSSGPREGGALHAALQVLKTAREPLAPQEIYDRAVRRGLAGGLKGKTPVATLAAQLATANKKGQYVERPQPGRYQLRTTVDGS